jgi:hypothetical protein
MSGILVTIFLHTICETRSGLTSGHPQIIPDSIKCYVDDTHSHTVDERDNFTAPSEL